MISWQIIVKTWRLNNMPELDEEMMEFLMWLAVRHSEGLARINIQKFLEIFSDDYMITKSDYDDLF